MMSSEPVGRHALASLVIPLLLSGLLSSGPPAGEATARGRNAVVIWLDENGQRQEVAGRQIRYGYYTRVYLKIPRDGKNYRDEEHQDRGIPFAEDSMRFNVMERIDFTRETDPDSGASRLVLTVTTASGKVHRGRGATLAGATHPNSPFILFTVDGAERRIELMPLAPEDQRRGKPQLVALDFSLR